MRCHRRVSVTCLLIGLIALTYPRYAPAQTFIFGKATLPVAANGTYVAEGDFNGDGVLDFAIANNAANTVSVILSRPNGSYAPKVDYAVTAPGSLLVADLNGDGRLDLAVAGTFVSFLLGNGDGTFQNAAVQSFGATSMAAGDFNKDGHLDLALAETLNGGIYLGNGKGGFTLGFASTNNSTLVAVGDFNNDGNLDALYNGGSSPQLLLGNGAGGFTAAAQAPPLSSVTTAVADFNGDGKMDIGVVTGGCSTHGGCHYYFNLYLGVGDGTFTSSGASAGLPGYSQIIAADINQDGKQDILAVPGGLLLGNGDGTFQPLASAPEGISPVAGVAGDFNNDGQLDIGSLDKNGWLALSLGNHGVYAGSALATAAATFGNVPVLADLNNDGKLDQITAGSSLVVQLGNGDGTFQAPLITPGAPGGSALTVGDFNNDGTLDVAVMGPGSVTLAYSVFLGKGDGTFQPPLNGTSNRYPLAVATADVNGDGKLDMLIPSQNGPYGVDVYLGHGDGTFAAAGTYGTCFPGGIVTGDFNGDGKVDAAVSCNDTSGGVYVLLGKGDGTFWPAAVYSAPNYYCGTLVSGDFNGDGKIDLAEGGFAGISGFLGNGDGTFQAGTSVVTGINPMAMTAGDFNKDGRTDLAALIYPTSLSIARLYFGNADGTFSPSFLPEVPTAGIVAGDLNGDGALDLFAVSPGSGASSSYTSLNVPVASLAPGQLDFPNQIVNTTSAPLSLTVSNAGLAPLTLGTATLSGDYALTANTCSGTLASGTSCLLQVTFTPVATGSRAGLITLVSNNYGGPAVLPLNGIGTASGAKVKLSNSSLTFASQVVGSTSAAQTITVTSVGTGAVTFAGITATGDFGQTNNCPAVLVPAAVCTISVTFAPVTTGTRTGSLVLTDNGPGGKQTVGLAGTGIAPLVSLSPASLNFGTQVIFNPGRRQTVVLTNTGDALLSIAGITVVGTNATDFTQTNTCGTSVAVAATCTITVEFRPSAINTRSAEIGITDNSGSANQTVSLSGTGTQVVLQPSLNFGRVTVGTPSTGRSVTLANIANTTVNLSGIAITGPNASDFAQTNTCTATVPPGKKCSFTVIFTPSAKGTRTAALAVTDDGGGSPQTVSLTGTGK
jgi:hypothetical protein